MSLRAVRKDLVETQGRSRLVRFEQETGLMLVCSEELGVSIRLVELPKERQHLRNFLL
jgi:hypothetical protein